MARINGKGFGQAKRGVLFALSAMLLGMVLLSFSLYLSQQSAKAKQTVAHILEIDSASNAYFGINAGLMGILSNAANFSVQYNGPQNYSLLASESLPISGQVAIDMGRFSQFESNYSDLNVTMSLASLNSTNLTFLVQPGGTRMTNTRITDSEGYFSIAPMDSADGAQSILSYEINLTFPTERLGDRGAVSWQAENASGNDNVTLRIRVQNSDYSFANDFQCSIDRHSGGTFNITDNGVLIGQVNFTSPASVQVYYTDNIGLKASIGFSHPIYVEANDIITVISAVNKTGRIRIA